MTFEVTFSRNGAAASFFDDNNNDDDPKDVDFLENIELMHCSDWQVDKCQVIVGKSAPAAGENQANDDAAAKPPKSVLRKGLELMLLTVFVVPAILGCLHGTWIGYVRANQT